MDYAGISLGAEPSRNLDVAYYIDLATLTWVRSLLLDRGRKPISDRFHYPCNESFLT